MNFIATFILGIVEGITEFLPISSTAHLDLTRAVLSIPASEFIKSFEIIIQLGAILAVVVLYRNKIFRSWLYVRNIVIAFIPTGVIGFILYKLIKTFLLGNTSVEIAILFIGGLIILYFEYCYKNNLAEDSAKQDIEKLSVKDLIILGTTQALAVIPGVSRSGAVIVCGRTLQIPRKTITEFSFLLAVPTMLAASVYDVYKSGLSITSGEWGNIAVGLLVSFMTALIVIKWLLKYIQKNSFKVFGWYRVVFAVIIFLYLYS